MLFLLLLLSDFAYGISSYFLVIHDYVEFHEAFNLNLTILLSSQSTFSLCVMP